MPGLHVRSSGLELSAALEVGDLVSLLVGLGLSVVELFLLLALALLVESLAPGLRVARDVADRLLGFACDLVCNSHAYRLPKREAG